MGMVVLFRWAECNVGWEAAFKDLSLHFLFVLMEASSANSLGIEQELAASLPNSATSARTCILMSKSVVQDIEEWRTQNILICW